MRKTTKKSAIVSAVLGIAVCVSVAAGATLALFTTRDGVNIAATSANVSVTATISDFEANSPAAIDPVTGTITDDTNVADNTGAVKVFAAGGTATLDGNDVVLDRMSAGDGVKFTVTVKNASNVRTQYRTRLECASDDGLFDELDIKIGEYTGRTVTKWQPLEAAIAESETIAVLSGEITLPADSVVMGKSCAISFAVEAVQFNADAKNDIHYPTDAADLKDSLSDGGQVYIYKDFATDESKTTPSDRTLINNPATIDLEATITVPGSLENSSNWAAIFIASDTTINANAGGINCVDKTDSSAAYGSGTYVANVMSGATVTVNGGTYYGGGTTFQVDKGTLIVNGGFFSVYPDIGTKDYRYVLNCIDDNYKNGTANIIVKGGTFVNFNPADNAAEGAGTNFVAEGYSVIAEIQDSGDVYYTVVEGNVKKDIEKGADGNYGLKGVNNESIYNRNETYSFPKDNYDGGFYTQHFGINSTFNGNGSTFRRFELNCGYVPTTENSTLVVSNLNIDGDLIITVSSNDVIIKNCTAKHISILGVNNDVKVIVDNCTITGTPVSEVDGNNKYGIYVTRPLSEGTAKISIVNSEISNVKGHAIAVNSSGATSDFNIKGNKFTNYGLDNGTDKAAFKIWGDGVLAPTENKGGALNAAATVLAESIKANNTFSTGDNCVVAEFYGAVLALN